MGKLSENIKGFFSLLFYLVFIFLYGSGIYHSFKKHDDGLATVFLLPLAIYRGAEMFWHDDFADIDWDKKLLSDVKTCIFFMNSVDDKEYSTYKYNKEVEEFSKTISKYPHDKRDYLKNVAKSYYKYSMSAIQDLILFIEKAYTSDNSKFTISNETKNLQDEFSKYISKEDLDIMISSLDTYMNTFSSMKEEIGDVSKYSEAFDFIVKKSDINYKTAYKDIFNEELK